MKRLLRALDAAAAGFTAGEEISQGETFKGVAIGVAIAAPLLFKRRFASLALAIAVGVGSYYFWEKIHGDALSEVPQPSNAVVN